MKERCAPEAVFEDVGVVVKGVDDKEQFIKKVIIPVMDKRRGRSGSLTQDEVGQKMLFPASKKPGEMLELMFAQVDSGGSLNADVALEIADNLYYSLQPNCPEGYRFCEYEYILKSRGVTYDLACAFCIVKYLTRLRCGDLEGYAAIEEGVMKLYLESLWEDL